MGNLHGVFSSYYDKFSNDDYEWVHYVRDHHDRLRSHMISMATIPMTQSEVTYRLMYRLNDFLREHNVPISAAWIVMDINQMHSEEEFHDIGDIYLPDMEDLAELRQEYDTQRAHAATIRHYGRNN